MRRKLYDYTATTNTHPESQNGISIVTKITFFYGPGGVGKSSLSASYAYYLSKQEEGPRVLLMSIDPSLRLKQFFQLPAGTPPDVHHVSYEDTQFYLFLMNGQWVLQQMMAKGHYHSKKNLEELRLLHLISHRLGGLNEIMSFLGLHYFFQSGNYDHIVVDTAPGGHFLSFFNSVNRMEYFFEEKLIKLFERVALPKKGGHLFAKLIDQSIQKSLQYLEKLTGANFVQDFVESLLTIYGLRDEFRLALKLNQKLSDPAITQYYLVVSPERARESYLKGLKDEIFHRTGLTPQLLLNQSAQLLLQQDLEHSFWKQNQDESAWKSYLQSLLEGEKRLHSFLSKDFAKILTFPLLSAGENGPNLMAFFPHWKNYL